MTTPMADYQNILFPYAYNILGSAEDARDAIQDVLANYYAMPREDVANEKAYLIRSVINQSINKKRRRKLVAPTDPWLPEPIATESADTNVYLKDILSYSLLVLLEKLSARERAVFILRESFDYGHDEIAGILGITEEHSRKLLSRAKARLFKPGGDAPQSTRRDAHTSALLKDYIDAIRARNMEKLEQLLTGDIAYYADGGPKVNVYRKITLGSPAVAELLIYVYHTYLRKSTLRVTTINHQPAFLFYNSQRLATCMVFDISPDGRHIMHINTVVDPEKLKGLSFP